MTLRTVQEAERLSLSTCARGGEMTLPCPGGQGGAACVRIRRCLPCGQKRCRAARRIWVYHGKSSSTNALPIRGLCRRAGGREALHPPLPRQRFPPAVPRGERRALPAPAQGIHPLGIPFWGTGLIFPRLPSPKTPQAASPCSWACRRLPRLRPMRNETKHPCPLLVGHGCVYTAPKALADRTAVRGLR